MSNSENTLKEAYSLFSKQMTCDEFKNKLDLLSIDKWNFIRAVLLYQQSEKCAVCNPNVAMSLLCSCADALELVGGERRSKANFMKFYLDFCPTSSRNSPIEYFPDGTPHSGPIQAPFEKALHYIYKQFRCLFIHKGVGRLDIPEKLAKDFGNMKIIPFPMMDKIRGEREVYLIDLDKIFLWFQKITSESLTVLLIT
jgi:hypothetical protein